MTRISSEGLSAPDSAPLQRIKRKLEMKTENDQAHMAGIQAKVGQDMRTLYERKTHSLVDRSIKVDPESAKVLKMQSLLAESEHFPSPPLKGRISA